MIYGYIRVSTDKQTIENQRFEILKFTDEKKLAIDKWIQETVSGTKKIAERKLGTLIKMPYRLLCNGVEQEDMETKLS